MGGAEDAIIRTPLDLAITADEAYALLLDRVGASEVADYLNVSLTGDVYEPHTTLGGDHLLRWLAARLASHPQPETPKEP